MLKKKHCLICARVTSHSDSGKCFGCLEVPKAQIRPPDPVLELHSRLRVARTAQFMEILEDYTIRRKRKKK